MAWPEISVSRQFLKELFCTSFYQCQEHHWIGEKLVGNVYSCWNCYGQKPTLVISQWPHSYITMYCSNKWVSIQPFIRACSIMKNQKPNMCISPKWQLFATIIRVGWNKEMKFKVSWFLYDTCKTSFSDVIYRRSDEKCVSVYWRETEVAENNKRKKKGDIFLLNDSLYLPWGCQARCWQSHLSESPLPTESALVWLEDLSSKTWRNPSWWATIPARSPLLIPELGPRSMNWEAGWNRHRTALPHRINSCVAEDGAVEKGSRPGVAQGPDPRRVGSPLARVSQWLTLASCHRLCIFPAPRPCDVVCCDARGRAYGGFSQNV